MFGGVASQEVVYLCGSCGCDADAGLVVRMCDDKERISGAAEACGECECECECECDGDDDDERGEGSAVYI